MKSKDKVLGVSAVIPMMVFLALAAHEASAGTRKATSDKGGAEFWSCPSGWILVSDRSGGTWPRVAGILDEAKMKKAVRMLNDVRYSCERKKTEHTKCTGSSRKVENTNPVDTDYCTKDKGLNIMIGNVHKAKCPSNSDATYTFVQTAGRDLCVYYRLPDAKSSTSTSTTSSSTTTTSSGAEAD